jgi:hypothetical protein
VSLGLGFSGGCSRYGDPTIAAYQVGGFQSGSVGAPRGRPQWRH